MKIDAVNVFGKVYKVQIVPLEDEDGLCETKKALISVANQLDHKDKVQTLMHECVHAIFDRLSITDILNDDIEEIICDSIGTFLVDNNLVKIPE